MKEVSDSPVMQEAETPENNIPSSEANDKNEAELPSSEAPENGAGDMDENAEKPENAEAPEETPPETKDNIENLDQDVLPPPEETDDSLKNEAEENDPHTLVIDPPDNELDPYEMTKKEEPEAKTDMEKAQEDLDYVIQEEEEYNKAVEEGRAQEDPTVRQQLRDSMEEAQRVYDRVQQGGTYEEPSFADFLRSDDFKETLQAWEPLIGHAVEKLGILPDGEYGVLLEHGPELLATAIDHGPHIAEVMHNTYDTESQSFLRDFNNAFPLRDADGNPVIMARNNPEDLNE